MLKLTLLLMALKIPLLLMALEIPHCNHPLQKVYIHQVNSGTSVHR